MTKQITAVLKPFYKGDPGVPTKVLERFGLLALITSTSGVAVGDVAFVSDTGAAFERAPDDAVDAHLDYTGSGGVKWYEAGPDFSTRARLVAAHDRNVAASRAIPGGTVWTWPDFSVALMPAGHAAYGTDPIADLAGWAPFGDTYADHFAENTTPGTTDMLAAVTAALASGRAVHFTAERYYFSDAIEVTSNGQRLIGAEGHGSVGNYGTRFEFDPTGTGDAITFARSDPNTTTLNQASIQNIEMSGGGNSSRTGWAINCKNCNQFYLDNVVWEGFYNGMLIQGGQNYFLNNWQHLSGGSASTISGTAALRIQEWTRTDITGTIAAYKIFSDGFTITGGTNFGTEFGVDVLFDDNNNFSNFYISRCGLSTIKIGGGDLNVLRPQFVNGYCDQVKFQASGGDHLIYSPATGSGSSSATFTNVIFGQSSGAAFNMTNPNAETLTFIGCSFINCDGGLGTISDAQCVQFSDCWFATVASGLTIDDTRTIQLSNLLFDGVSSGAPLTISGTVDNLSYDGIDLVDCAADISVTATGWSQRPRASWYERGTWAPEFTFNTTSDATYTAEGEYSKVGDRIDFQVNVTFTALGSSSGFVRFSLPETPAGGRSINNIGYVVADNLNSGIGSSALSFQITPGSTTARIFHQASGTRSGLINSEMTDTTVFEISGSYFVDNV